MKKFLLTAALAAAVFTVNAENKVYFFKAYGDEEFEQMGSVYSISPNGEYAVIYDEEMEQSFLWKKSDPENLQILNRIANGKTQAMEVRAVNDKGTIIGSIRQGNQWHPFIKQEGGEIIALPLAEWAINLNFPCAMSADENVIGGQMGGSCQPVGMSSFGQNRPCFWVKGSDGEYELYAYSSDDLTLPEHDGTTVMGMYSDGTLAGSYLFGVVGMGAGSHAPFLYQDKEFTIWHELDHVKVGWLYKGEIRGYETIETIDGFRDYYHAENDAFYSAFNGCDTEGNIYGSRTEVYDVAQDVDPMTDPANYGRGKFRNYGGYYNVHTKEWTTQLGAPSFYFGYGGKLLFNGMRVYPDGLESTPQDIASYFNLDFQGKDMSGIARTSVDGSVLGGGYTATDNAGIPHEYPCMVVMDKALVGVDGVDADPAMAQSVKVVDGTIEVTGAENVVVYNMTGMKVATGNRCTVSNGVYVVVADGISHKVMVK